MILSKEFIFKKFSQIEYNEIITCEKQAKTILSDLQNIKVEVSE